MSFSRPRIELIAVDDGYDATKAVSRAKSARISTAFSLNPSTHVTVMGKGEEVESLYEIEGIRYAVGPNVVGQDTRFEEFPYHPANLAVTMDAIRRVVDPGTPVHVVAGMPLTRFYLPSGETNVDVSRRKTLAWARSVRSVRGPVLPRIVKVSVIAEAVAAWFDFVIDDQFVVRDHLINDFMAVVDIGGRTTDIAVFQDGNINMALSNTLDKGVLQIQKRVVDILSAKYPGTQFPRSLLNEAVKFGQAQLGATSLEVSKEVIAERRSLASSIEIFIRAQFGNQLPLMQRVLFVGGGAQVLQFELKERFQNAVFATDPQMANARGMLKYGITVAGFADDRETANAS